MCKKCSHCRIYSASISSSLVLISGLSCKTTFNKELWTSSFPLYSMKPNLRNLFMKKLSRDRLGPAFLAEVCKQKEKPGEALFARIEQLVDQVLFNSAVPSQ